ncbi:nucleotidyl transferase AbiEii/AbiGii toxin family protein, partial [Myxococcota bacterium]|nr:nucleotidyl transferase AbiEii/AbiGii toxin family protein [Myxococcota bacterium]
MITKAHLLDIAKQQALLPTTIEKDYVLGWLLYAIANHERLSRWVFKGGTCLKKCFFETYRFSEDLDFTIPTDQTINSKLVKTYLEEIVSWIEENSGLTFPRQ